MTKIDYATEDSLEDVVEWYKGELGEPTFEESSAGETKLGYRFDDPAGWVEIEISTNDYTKIEVEHVKTAN
ncbi:MAG: hypothetical protein U5K00_06100 [Melioribacteraceae bacterium]|nr:hypothetical protein [Melioribacteraceae bacterium]